MIKIFINIVFWIYMAGSMLVFSQKNTFSSNISDCSGAIYIELNRVFKPKLPINLGEVEDILAYSKEFKLPETNSLWFRFESTYSGWLHLTLRKMGISLEYGVFALEKHQDCDAVFNGEAQLLATDFWEAGFNNAIDSIPYSKNQTILLYINTTSSSKNEISINASFNEQVSEAEFESMKKTFDLRNAENDPPFNIMIRDAKTKLPVVANVIVSESRTHNALYSASDMIFTHSENIKMTLNIDATGYFFQDLEVNTRKNKETERIVYLEALEQNQLIELEGLVFESQTDGLIADALPKLKRLKDFMVINTTVDIEIQGHVHLDGKNTIKAKRLSKKRAKTVRDFLVESGIDKKRISVVGYGNSEMRYPDASSDAEKQANRRVEIKIK